MANIFEVRGPFNQTNLKKEIKTLWDARPNDNDILLRIRSNPSLRSFFKKINLEGFADRVTELHLVNLHNLRNIEGIAMFKNLRMVRLENCATDQLPEPSDKLEILELIYHHWHPGGIRSYDFSIYPNLKEIFFEDTAANLSFLNMERLDKLERLQLDCYDIADFPIARLTNLEVFHLVNHNRLEGPENIINSLKNNENLEELRLSYVKINEINNDEFPKLKKLRLELCNPVFNLDKIPNLESLHLERIFVTNENSQRFVSQIEKCVNLKELFYINTRSASLQTSFTRNLGNLINLETLVLSKINLEHIPDTIGNLTSLINLNLTHNNLENLPPSITNLTSLGTIDLSYNEGLEDYLNEVAPGLPLSSMQVLQYFSSRCLKRTLLVKSLNKTLNESSIIRTISLKSLDLRQNKLKIINAVTSRNFDLELINRDILPYIEQLKDYINTKGTQKVDQRYEIDYSDILHYGMFRVYMQGEAGIDAGGLYRQLLSDVSSSFETEYMEKFKVVNKDDKETLNIEMTQKEINFAMSIAVLLFNTGEGNFESIFTFGHCINIWYALNPGKNIMESKIYDNYTLGQVVKDFAINFLEEPSDPVNELSIDNHRLETYLWLMNEFITNERVIEEGSACSMVKTYNTTGMGRPSYDYIFMGADMEREHPVFEEPEEDFSYLYQNDTAAPAPENNSAAAPRNNTASRNNIPQLPLPPGVEMTDRRDINLQNISNRLDRLRRSRLPANEPLPDVINRLANNNNNNEPEGVDLEELRDRLQGSGIDTPESQALMDEIDAQIDNPVDPEDLERRVNEILRNQVNATAVNNLPREYANLTYDRMITNIELDTELLIEMTRNIPLSEGSLRHFNRVKEAEPYYIRRRDAGFPGGVNIDIIQNKLDELRLAIETLDRLILENEQANAAPANNAANQGNDANNAPANQGNGPSWRDVPTGQVLRVLEDAILRPIDEQDLEDITDAAIEAANERYDPLQYHERHDNNAIITLLGDVPSYIPRFMDIYFTILGRDIMNETIISWLENADSSIRNGFLIMLHSEIETLNANPTNNAANAQGNNAEPRNNTPRDDLPSGELLGMMNNAIRRTPISENDLRDLTDAATEAANDRYNPLQHNERYDNLYPITMLRQNPQFVFRFMDIYFNILGRDVRTESINSWLENADEEIRESLYEIYPLRNPDNAPGNNADGNAPRNNTPRNNANAPRNNAAGNAPGNNAPRNNAAGNAPRNNAAGNAPRNNADGNAPRNNAAGNAPLSIRNQISQLRRGSVERNTLSIAEFPYVVRSMVNRYGPNWRQNREALSTFRDTITRETRRNINNEQVMRDYQTARPRRAERYVRNNPNWMDTIEGRRDLRTRARRVGVQFGGSNNDYDERYATSQKNTHLVGVKIINAIYMLVGRHKHQCSLFIDRAKKKYLDNDINVFYLFNMLHPDINIKPETLMGKINFSQELNQREREILEKVINDFKADLSPADIESLNSKIKELTDKEDQNLDTLFPSQEKFLGDLLYFWSGSKKLSNTRYHFMYRRTVPYLETHTCFNQLITGVLVDTKDFLEKFITAFLMAGTAFGIAGRRHTLKKKRRSSPQVFRKFRGSKQSLSQRQPSFKTLSKGIGRTKKLLNRMKGKHLKPKNPKKRRSKKL